MESFKGISIPHILSHNNNWDRFLLEHGFDDDTGELLIRQSIIDNISKVIACKEGRLGYSKFVCYGDDEDNNGHHHNYVRSNNDGNISNSDSNSISNDSNNSKLFAKPHHELIIKHSCKSRFCSSCAKKATDDWIKNAFLKLPDSVWQHVTLTMPEIYWELFWLNRDLMNIIPKIAADLLKEIAWEKYKVDIGIFLVIHTFGRRLNRNYHIHLTVMLQGITKSDDNNFKFDNGTEISARNLTKVGIRLKKIFFHHDNLKKRWRMKITNLLRSRFKEGNLIIPRKWIPDFAVNENGQFCYKKNYTKFNKILDNKYQKNWVIHLNKTKYFELDESGNIIGKIDNIEEYRKKQITRGKSNKSLIIESNTLFATMSYIGRYLKRPPLSEANIKYYDGTYVEFEYKDHRDNKRKRIILTVNQFIATIIIHIPDKYFRNVRYYGIVANRNRSTLLAMFEILLNQRKVANENKQQLQEKAKENRELKNQQRLQKNRSSNSNHSNKINDNLEYPYFTKINNEIKNNPKLSANILSADNLSPTDRLKAKIQNQDHNYRSMIKRAFGKDPMICPIGQSELKLSYKLYRSKADIRYDDVIRRRELAERNSTNNNPNNHSKIIS
jgi:hypothetical protein